MARSQETATACCTEPKCQTCGEARASGWIHCDSCRAKLAAQKEKDRFDAAEKIPAANYTGWVYSDAIGSNNGFSTSVEEFSDAFECHAEPGTEPPAYVWACAETHFCHADIGDITSGMEGEAYEDFDFNDLNGLTELKAALDAFNAANEDKISYSPDYKRAVILTKTP